MAVIEMFLLGFGVSIDAFSVSISGGMIERRHPWKNAGLAALFFGFFQMLMPVAGGFLGEKLGGIFNSLDHYIAAVLLFAIGIKMIYEALKHQGCESPGSSNPFRIKPLFILAIATSIDAMAVGASITFGGHNFWDILIPAALVMGGLTALFSFTGVWIGRFFGCIFGNRMEIVGGLVLIGIGIKILYDHLGN